MKPILYRLTIILFFIANQSIAQVSTIFNNETTISGNGRFDKKYGSAIDVVLPAQNIDSLLSKEKQDIAQSNDLKPFRLAAPTKVNLDIPKLTNWTYEKEFAYGKFTLRLSGAMSVSISFDKFYLPKNTEMFVYNENGKMITGPVTEKENNKAGIWGSWVYQGELLTIEIKTPIASMKELILHSDNVAYGYKEIYTSIKVGGFGQSGPCNINVICPLGNGWERERNAVSTILSDDGGEFCTGALVMNTCGTNNPYYLTANHCFENGNSNVAGWRFAFQAWSTTCPNPGVNTSGVMYNGATLRARNAQSDFCLVELKTSPPPNSGLHYAGWNRSATPAQNATGIHHPRGDLMKISRSNNPVTVGSYRSTTDQHWRVNWSPQNNGAGQTVTAITERASSGSPLFDQNRRIIGQLHGGPSSCGSSQPWDFYGRFDLSWTGGGTNDTRLSNWLDPDNSGALTTNTTNVNDLIVVPKDNPAIVAPPNPICSTATLTLNGVSTAATVTWVSSDSTIATVTPNGLSAVVTKNKNGITTISAAIMECGRPNRVVTRRLEVGTPLVTWPEVLYPTGVCLPQGFNVTYTTTSQFGAYYEWGYYEGASAVPSPYVLVNAAGSTQQPIRINNEFAINRISVRGGNACGLGTQNIREFLFDPRCNGGVDVEYKIQPKNNVVKVETTPAKFKIVENAVRSVLYVQIPISAQQQAILISDANGRVMKRMDVMNTNIEIDVSAYAAGVYTVTLISNTRKVTHKFVKY
jgi:lysyl endopeptidase